MTLNHDLYREVDSLPGGKSDIGGLVVDWEWRLLRDFMPEPEGDGSPARVWAKRAPAQFFRLTAGDIEITTGSGTEMGELMIALARAIADGMVSFRNFMNPNGEPS
jgi:hypothetical protein